MASTITPPPAEALAPTCCIGCGTTATRLLVEVQNSRYLTCEDCGLVRADRIPSESELVERAEYWSHKHHLQDEKLQRQFDPDVQAMAYKRVLRELAPFRRTGRLLEIGCAAGGFLDAACRAGWQPTGIELSESAARYAREQHGFDVRGGTLSTVDLGGELFDVAVMIDVIEHVRDPGALLAQVREVLVPDGALLVMTPNVRSLGARSLGSYWEAYAPNDHLWLFDSATLQRLCEERGFAVLRRWTIDCNPFVFAHAIRSRLGSRRQAEATDPASAPAIRELQVAIQRRNRLIHTMKRSRLLRLARQAVNAVLGRLDLGDKLYLLVERR